MSKVFVNIGLSLDGYMAPEGMTMGKPEYKNWGAKWGALMTWLINQQYFRDKSSHLTRRWRIALVIQCIGRSAFKERSVWCTFVSR